ncbi:MAG TPA: hypothetical protein ENI57_07895 [Ignavibacteria bacterium]|nr:hypothetical protein [Ignavibacteria bacterium]
MKQQNNKVKKIQFKISEIKKIEHFEKDFKEYGLKLDDLKKCKLETQVGLNIDPQKSSIAIKFSANFFFTQGIKKINLFGIKTLHSFKIRSFNKTLAILNNNEIDLPDNFIKTLLGISISSSRGMMAVLNTNPAYQKYNIPLMNPTELIETMMKH